jgi:glutathione S-transferase
MTIADISAACEINQLHLFGFDFTPYPQIKEWLERCLSHPAMKEAHVPFYKVLEKMKAKPKL